MPVRLHALDRKLLRDLWQMRSQALAISLVVASSIAVFVMSLSTWQSLLETQRAYYERYRFADVFAGLKRAPAPLAERIAAIPGVAAVDTRVVASVVLDVPGLAEPASGRLISIPDRGRPALNDVYLRSGRLPEPGVAGEALAAESFAEANHLGPGSEVSVVVHGRWQRLRIVGVALSPEYVYSMPSGDLFPDDKRFGVFWMRRDEVEGAVDMRGAFNDVSLRLAPGASIPEVIARLDRLLRPYGGAGAYGRDKQVSARYLSEEIKQLKANAVAIPGVFLAVAAFLLHVVLTRTVGTQRAQIATLKAFGYDDRRIGLHYLELTLVIALLGTVLGSLAGFRFGVGMTQMYARFYRFPMLQFAVRPGDLAFAILISSGAAVLGSVGAVRRVVRLPPAEAMQPEPPPVYRKTLLERAGLAGLLRPPGRMILRNLERRPGRALLSILAMGFAVSILVVGAGQLDAINVLTDVQFNAVQGEDVTVSWVEPRGAAAPYEVARLPGVMRVEPFRAVTATLRSGNRTWDTAVMGLTRDARLRRAVDREGAAKALPEEGVVLTTELAHMLRVAPGDRITVEVREGRRPVLDLQVVDLVDELVGVSAYMDLDALDRAMREGRTSSGVFLRVDPQQENALYRRLKITPGVAGVSIKRRALESFQATVAENLNSFRVVLVLFAVIIAFGVVYNAARIAFAERARELASLRVLGFTRGEISLILLGELGLLTILSIPIGCLLGYGLLAWLVWAFATDMFRIPLIVAPASFAWAAFVVAAAAALSALVVRRKLDRLDLVEVLKTRE